MKKLSISKHLPGYYIHVQGIHFLHTHVHVCIVAFLCCQKKNPLLTPIDPLPPRPKGDSKAEWAVKNMYYNPGTLLLYICLESCII